MAPYVSSAPRTWTLTELKSSIPNCLNIRLVLNTHTQTQLWFKSLRFTYSRHRLTQSLSSPTHRLMMLSAVRRAFSAALGPPTGQTAVALKPSMYVAHTWRDERTRGDRKQDVRPPAAAASTRITGSLFCDGDVKRWRSSQDSALKQHGGTRGFTRGDFERSYSKLNTMWSQRLLTFDQQNVISSSSSLSGHLLRIRSKFHRGADRNVT